MTLQIYFARRFLASMIMVIAIFGGLLWLTDTVENLRRYDPDVVGFPQAAGLAALKLPENLYQILPIMTVLATVSLFVRMARTSELVVTRAAGRSAIRALTAPVTVIALVGMLAVAVLNPVIAATSKMYQQRSDELNGGARVLSISDEGLWLRQGTRTGQLVIHAARASADATVLFETTFIAFSDAGSPIWRMQAARAELIPGAWDIQGAKIWPLAGVENPETRAEVKPAHRVDTDLTQEQIRDSFGAPATIAIWDLPEFIDRLERAGFSAREHRVWLHMELASPLFLVAMVLIGAGFTMRHTRMGNTGRMILLAVLSGFFLFFLKSFAQVLGDTGKVAPILAAWFPAIAGVLLPISLLLHTEDG